MRYDPDRHHRRSTRLQGYDYSRDGAYFVTGCVHNRECLLGEIRNGTVILSEVGQAIESVWTEIPKRFSFIVLDEYVLMPNHLHGILFFIEPTNPTNVEAQEGVASNAPSDFLIRRIR